MNSLFNFTILSARRFFRSFVFLALLASLSSLALVAGFLQAAPLSPRGSTGQALALRAALRAMVPLATHAKTFRDFGVPADTRRGPDGRYVYNKASLMRAGAIAKAHASSAVGAQVDEAVQTFDVFNPPPGFTPTQGPGLTPTNLTPVWTADETMLVFSSNRTTSGGIGTRYHIWAIPINGGTPVQLTDSAAGAGEFFPALSAGNNTEIAFTSDAQSPGTQNLYAMPFTAQTVNVASLTSPTIRTNDPLAQAQGGTGFDSVGRPTFNPTNSDEIIFSAHSTEGANTGHFHLYFLYQSTGGFNNAAASLPAKLTDGPADDTDPAYSQDGQLIAFASTSPSLAQTNVAPSSNFNTALLATTTPTSSLRNIFLIGGGGRIGFGNPTNAGAPTTLPGKDNFGPAWSSPRRNVYLNPAPGTEYIAFSRGASPTSPHDIFYLSVLQNIDAGGESGRSNEAGTTPVPAVPTPAVANLNDTPVYQINSGGPEVTDPNFPDQDYKPGDYTIIDPSTGQIIQPAQIVGGTVEALTPVPVVNLINDPFTPPAVYRDEHTGTFQYTFKFLTPGADYRVRLHLSDPKDTKPGQRVFSVSINGVQQTVIVPDPTTGLPTQTSTIDIVQQAQSAPGRLLGLVQDATGNPLAGVTITVADYTTGAAIATNPSPLVTSGTTTTPAGVTLPINYSGGLARGTYLVTATPAAGSGFGTLTQIVNVTSGSASRADFTLPQGTGTLSGTVTDAGGKTPILGATITLTDSVTGAIVSTSPSPITTGTDGTYTANVPVGTYDATATPPPTSGYAVSTILKQPVTANTTTTTNFALASGTAVGTVGGLVTNSVSLLPIAGATVKFLNSAGTVIAMTQTTTATTSPAAPNGDGNPVNYTLLVPIGAGTLQFSAPGYTAQSQAVTVVNTPATGTTAAVAFVRADKALVPKVAPTGQNTAVVDDFVATALTSPLLDAKGFNLAPAGSVYVAFNPVSGDPPIVQAIELISSSNPSVSSSFGGVTGTPATAAPTLVSAIGGSVQPDPTKAAAPRVLLTIEASSNTGTPSSYNVYRTPGTPTSENTPPLPSPSGSEGNTPYIPNAQATDTGKSVFDPTTGLRRELYTITDPTPTFGDEYFYQVTAVYLQSVTPETAATGSNPVVQLNTDDNAGQTGTAGNAYDDVYPTWSPFISVFSIAYSSNRTVTYSNPAAANAQSETAVSVGQGQPLSGGATVGAGYAGILESQVLNLDPPTLLPYSGNEILHIADSSGNTTRSSIQPGQPVTVVVRLSSREAGIDDTGGPNGGPNVYLQIKDPDSKYQDAQGREHKVFAKDQQFEFQSNNPGGFFGDSGSSTLLMNGGGGYFQNGFDSFPTSNGTLVLSQRGAVGGVDGAEAFGTGVGPGNSGNKSNTISIGRSGGGVNPAPVLDAKGAPVKDANGNLVLNLPGSDPNLFIPTGPEYECQVVNPQFGADNASSATGATDTSGNDYVSPYYLAGVDDQQPFSGAGRQRPTVNANSGNGSYRPAEWLQFSRLPAAQQDGQGGVLYSVTWKTPTSGSDYYLDVIAFDKATPPRSFQGTSTSTGQAIASNWRIYDNVWGFSTAASLNNNDILVVSDYALGQKFAATTFGGQRGLLNLVPKLYGSESYVTDIDVNLLPNAIYKSAVFPGADPNNPQAEVLNMDQYYNPDSQDTTAAATGTFTDGFQTLNGFGVGSYYDRFIDDGGRADGAPSVRSQQYSLWRVLSRGPVPDAVYQAYEPTIVSQPAVTDPAAPKGLTSVPAGKVPAANRCIFWLSPFTGDVLAGPGTLLDSNTQASLAKFVAAGGRLCVSGQDVGSALTQGGTANNTASGFLSSVLGATLATANGGTHIPVPAPIASDADGRISNTPYFDGQVLGTYVEVNPGNTISTVPPAQRLIRVSNNYGGNIFSVAFVPNPGYNGNWRTDGSLDQLGPYIQPFPVQETNNSNAVVAQIDTILPNKTAHLDLTLAPFTNPIPPLDNGNDNAASAPGGPGLIYTENPITATGGTGSKVVYSTFGLEALSTEYYKQTSSFKPNPIIYEPRNQRQDILHNIVNYLRTGSISGTVRATTGNGNVGSGVPGVTVYVVDAYGVAIPGRGTFSATTDTAGNFRIDGIEPGNYTLAAYKTGFTRTVSNPGVVFTIEGDSTQTASLTISQSTGGAISGTVTDGSSKPVAGATVTFTSSDGTTTQNTVTDGNGNYTLPNVPPTTYTGVATDPATGGVSAVSAPVIVTANSSATVNFVLKAGPGSVTGRVVDASTNLPIPGATVTFSSGTPPAVVTTGTTDKTGTYNVTGVPAGTYSVTASAPGYGNSLPISVVVTGNQTTNPQDIPLGPVVNGTLGGLVTSTSSTTPAAGVTITIVNAGTGVAVPAVTSSGASTAGPDGAPLNYGPITVAQGTYTVTASSNGVTTASQTVTVAGSQFTRVDFTGVTGLPPVHTFSAGLNFLSSPYDYSSVGFDAIFGSLNVTRSHVAIWDPTRSVYALDPTAPADAFRLGQGYWVNLTQPVAVTRTGTTPSGTVAVALNPSWNQIGVPSLTGVLVSSLTFDMGNGTTPLTFAAAVGSANHVVSPLLYRFDGAAYQPVASTDTLQPWQAYWIKVFTPTTVRIPTGR